MALTKCLCAHFLDYGGEAGTQRLCHRSPLVVKDRSAVEQLQIGLLLILSEGRFKFFSVVFQEDRRYLNKQPGTVDLQA